MASAARNVPAVEEEPLRVRPGKRTRIAYVCLGNSCRSQMAEGWTRHLSQNTVEAVSAGVSPLGHVAAETIAVMEEKRVRLDGHQSKGLNAVDWKLVDVLVNMSHWPTASVAPEFEGRWLEWEVEDPYGDDLATYRRVRDLLEEKVRGLLEELEGPSRPPPAAPAAS